MNGGYCKKCAINWKALMIDVEEERDEEYPYCPNCLSGLDLEDMRDGVSYMPGEFKPQPFSRVKKKSKERVYTESVEEFKARCEAAHEAYLNEYFRLHAQYGHDLAASMVKQEKLTRDFYYKQTE